MESLHQHKIKDSPIYHTVPAACIMSVKKPQALSKTTYPSSSNHLLIYHRLTRIGDPVDRQLPVEHVRTISRITTAGRTGHKRQLNVHPSQNNNCEFLTIRGPASSSHASLLVRQYTSRREGFDRTRKCS